MQALSQKRNAYLQVSQETFTLRKDCNKLEHDIEELYSLKDSLESSKEPANDLLHEY
jgi:phage shock protein A